LQHCRSTETLFTNSEIVPLLMRLGPGSLWACCLSVLSPHTSSPGPLMCVSVKLLQSRSPCCTHVRCPCLYCELFGPYSYVRISGSLAGEPGQRPWVAGPWLRPCLRRAYGAAVISKAQDAVLPFPPPCQQVEVFCVGVAIGQVSDPCSLPRDGSL
jgi:hypothetical protein